MADKTNLPEDENKPLETNEPEEDIVDVAEDEDDVNTEESPELTDEEKDNLEALANQPGNEALRKLLANTSFYAHSVARASAPEMKDMLSGQRIISDDDKVRTTKDNFKEDVKELVASADAHRILRGKLTGLRFAGGDEGDESTSTILATVNFGHNTVPVLIPEYLLFHHKVVAHRTVEEQRALQKRITGMIGIDIDFVVAKVDLKNKVAYADRLQALDTIGYNNYVRPLNGTGKPRVRVGSVIDATITYVGKNFLLVNGLGSETIIYQDAHKGKCEVSWNYLTDCRLQFKRGMRVPVKVMSIRREKVQKWDNTYDLIFADFSIRQCKEDPQVAHFDDFCVGQTTRGIVVSTDPLIKGIFVILEGNGGNVDCLCAKPRYGALPEVGDEVIVRITEKDTKNPKTGATKEEDGRLYRRIFGVFVEA